NYFNEIDPATNSNLVGYYTMNQGIPSGNNTSLLTLYDQKGNNNGTLNGFSLSGSTSNFIAQSNNLTILPLKWLSFIAQKQISSVLLKWSTVSESHTSDFSIEHSADGRNWKNIGLVSSINNMEPHSYSYVHTAPSAGYNFYRIRQNDKDGKYSYSIIVHVDFGKTSVPFTLISNPVMNKTLQLRVNSSVNQSITLLGGEGKIIWKKEFPAGIYAIDMNMLPKGIYILKAEGYSEKLILQ
ncbi:MAG TPA: hypothetical protein VNS32_23985, partial [Flavisolibacter sp.]|nr:hypothetical protein [Flavisolibacter sp.]